MRGKEKEERGHTSASATIAQGASADEEEERRPFSSGLVMRVAIFAYLFACLRWIVIGREEEVASYALLCSVKEGIGIKGGRLKVNGRVAVVK